MVDCFDHRELLRRLREKLARTTDDAECQSIVRQIEAEELKASLQSRTLRKTTLRDIFKTGVQTGRVRTQLATRVRRPIGLSCRTHRRRSAPPYSV